MEDRAGWTGVSREQVSGRGPDRMNADRNTPGDQRAGPSVAPTTTTDIWSVAKLFIYSNGNIYVG